MNTKPTFSTTLDPFFKPKGIVVCGVSQDPTKLGFGLARNLVQSDYRGAIHFVNPKGGTLLERPVYTAVAHVPDPVDLAVLLIPAAAIPQTLRECGERGIKAAIIAAGGFRETGPQGAALEAECLEIASQYNMRFVGPNCIGILDTHLPLDTTFLPPPGPTPGHIAFLSHSGAICAAVIDWARGQGFGLSRLVSLGNQANVTETDMLPAVADDPYTRVLTLYLEGISNGRHFVQTAETVTRTKPIVALKVGRSASGQRAAASHTGALAGQEAAFNAAFRRAGVIRANTSEELFDWARALAWCPLPKGRQVAILTNAGGPGVTAADALEANGLQLATLQPETIEGLKALLPAGASLHNPVDMLASASPAHYAGALRLLLADNNVHSVLVILPPPPMHATGSVARAMIPLIYAADKPVVVSVMGEKLIQEAVEHFRAAQVPEYRFPERAAAALGVLAERAEYLQRENRVWHMDMPDKEARVQALLAQPVGQDGFLPPETAVSLLAAYGISTPQTILAATADEAVAAAHIIGCPVVMKIASPDIAHKSDIGGILLNVTGETAVREGFHTLIQNAKHHAPHAQLQGVTLSPMIGEGQEVIVGIVRDPHFGPLVMFGSGGVEVEGLGDVAFALAPLTPDDADYLLKNTWAGRRLDGFRHLPPADKTAVRETLFRLAQLAADFPQIQEIEINPLRVMPAQKGAVALDARVRLAQPTTS
jgi:acetyltransferase